MPRNPRIPPAWFDTEQGTLLVGSQQELGPLVDNPNVRRLGELLCTEEFPYKSGDFEQIIPTDDWSQEEFKIYGRWLLGALKPFTAQKTSDHRFTETHIKRARILGVGPSLERTKTRVGTIIDYRELLNLPSGRTQKKYNEWSKQDFARYAAEIASKLGRRPTRKDYREAREKWGGPGTGIIETRIGGFNPLSEMIGYPDISDWDEHDYLQWGTDIMRANNEVYPSRPLIDEISKRRAGPSTFAIEERFDRLSFFQHQVTHMRQEQLEEYAQHRDAQQRWAKENLDKESLAIAEDLPEAEQLAFIGRYRTAQRCLEGRDVEVYRSLARTPSDTFISRILALNHRAGFKAGNVEETADMLNVFNDIWPPVEYLKRLHVSHKHRYKKPRVYNTPNKEEPNQKAA